MNLLMWRWLCSTGVYHAAANTLSLEITREIVYTGGQTVEEFLCKHQHVWGEDDVYFDRCAAGLGMSDAEHRLAKVKQGSCKPIFGKEPADWELFQMKQFGQTLQLSCDPASPTTGFAAAIGGCAAAFRLHFPCKYGSPDYEICSGEWFGMVVKKEEPVVPFHRLCGGHDVLRKIFSCADPKPHREGTNKVMYALEWERDQHDGKEQPWNIIKFFMGTKVGVWGGWCTCPDGRVYQVGDEGNMCLSVGCDGGTQGVCSGGETEGAFRKVVCEPPNYEEENKKQTSSNIVIEYSDNVGVWGGTCTCADGLVYLVGDEGNACGSLACENGLPGSCNHYVSIWAHRKVKCADPWPPPPPLPPPSPPLPPPPLLPPPPPPPTPPPPLPPPPPYRPPKPPPPSPPPPSPVPRTPPPPPASPPPSPYAPPLRLTVMGALGKSMHAFQEFPVLSAVEIFSNTARFALSKDGGAAFVSLSGGLLLTLVACCYCAKLRSRPTKRKAAEKVHGQHRTSSRTPKDRSGGKHAKIPPPLQYTTSEEEYL